MLTRRMLLLAMAAVLSLPGALHAGGGGGGGSKSNAKVQIRNETSANVLAIATDNVDTYNQLLALQNNTTMSDEERLQRAKDLGAVEISAGGQSKNFSLRAGTARIIVVPLGNDSSTANLQPVQTSFNVSRGQQVTLRYNGTALLGQPGGSGS